MPRGASGRRGMWPSHVAAEHSDTVVPRASENAQPSTPSKTPVGVTKALTDLRLTYARLLEEHGSTTATLKRREAELASAEQRNTDAEASIEALQVDVRNLKAEVARKERERELADREVSFLQAMVVRIGLI